MNSIKTLCAAAVLTASAPFAANASTLLIDFDGASGDGGEVVSEKGDKSYHVDGYIMDPVNIQGGLCADGKCTIESTQTVEPTLYREDFSDYDLLSFYFLNTGKGAEGETDEDGDPANNFTTLSLYDDYGDVDAAHVFKFGDQFEFSALESLGLTIDYFDGEGSDPGSVDACFEDKICKNYGYVIGLGEFGMDIGRAVWMSAGDANARLDDMLVNVDVNEIPLPAAAWLLLGGLGGLAAVRRRRPS